VPAHRALLAWPQLAATPTAPWALLVLAFASLRAPGLLRGWACWSGNSAGALPGNCRLVRSAQARPYPRGCGSVAQPLCGRATDPHRI